MIYWGFPTRMMYLYYMLCLRYTFLAGNPRYIHLVGNICFFSWSFYHPSNRNSVSWGLTSLHNCTWSRHVECLRSHWLSHQGTVYQHWPSKLLLFVGCLTSQQHASVSQGRICSDNYTCCHTEIEVADPTFYLTQSQFTDTRLTSPSADPIMPGAWQGSHWSPNFWVTGMTRPWKNPSASGIRTWDLPLSMLTPYH